MSTFIPQEVIRKKMLGHALSDDEIRYVIQGVTDMSLSEAQVACFAMAVWFNKLSIEEAVTFTEAMRDSGTCLDWSGLDGPVIDKHSTGGVGDNISLVLAPVLAAAGAFVPMISGRGLGHTGGTLDKLDAIPGYNSQPSLEELARVTKNVGCAIVGANDQIAPADQRLYSIRDLTGTVDSSGLIATSILSKKLAAGLDSLVLDVKFGSGAFMQAYDDARELALSLVKIANGAGCPTTALITDMDQPLAPVIGNSIETAYAIDVLLGKVKSGRFHSVVIELGSESLRLAGIVNNVKEGKNRIEELLQNGSAAEKFEHMVAELGGPVDILNCYGDCLPKANITRLVQSRAVGYVGTIDTRALGVGVTELGGGRTRAGETIDYSVGFSELLAVGDVVDKDIPLGKIHARTEDEANRAEQLLAISYRISPTKPNVGPVFREVVRN